MERNYIIVSNEHSYGGSALTFWGRRTKDEEPRSYGGYTKDLRNCEMYTREELEDFRGRLKEEYPFFNEIKPYSFHKHNEVLATIDEIKSLGFQEAHTLIG